MSLPSLLTQDCDFHLAGWLYCLLGLGGFEEVRCHIEDAHMSRNWGWALATASKERKPSVQWPLRNWILPTTTRAEKWLLPHLNPEMKPQPGWHFNAGMWGEAGEAAKLLIMETVMISVCCFKLLYLGVITMQQEIINILPYYKWFQKMHVTMHLTERMLCGIFITLCLSDND